MMQENIKENNNFDTIISTWRRMSGEQMESVTVSMSGDSHDLQLHKKKDEEASLLAPERLKGPIATVASAGAATNVAEVPSVIPEIEEKLLKRENEDGKEAAGDTNDIDDGYLENKEIFSHNPEEKKDKVFDKVDSGHITHQVIKVPPRSIAPAPEEEDCGIKCLYYTLQCCDCVLM